LNAITYLLAKISQLLPNLFYTIQVVYTYQEPAGVIKEKITALLNRSGKFWSGPDIDGRFVSADRFTLIAASGAYTQGVKYASTLYGQVMDSEDAPTRIEIKICASRAYKTICSAAVVLGSILLLMAVSALSLEFLLVALAMLVLGPLGCNWLAGIANETVKDRYLRYIHRELRSALTHRAAKG
jgi:hypothetical protein